MRVLNISRQLFTFALVGAVGFAIDAGILTALSQLFAVNLYLARLVSFTFASFGTWLLNRSVTFRDRTRGVDIQGKEYARYMVVQIVAALANLLVFSVLIAFYKMFEAYPIIPLAIGAVFGLAINFTGARLWVYAQRESVLD